MYTSYIKHLVHKPEDGDEENYCIRRANGLKNLLTFAENEDIKIATGAAVNAYGAAVYASRNYTRLAYVIDGLDIERIVMTADWSAQAARACARHYSDSRGFKLKGQTYNSRINELLSKGDAHSAVRSMAMVMEAIGDKSARHIIKEVKAKEEMINSQIRDLEEETNRERHKSRSIDAAVNFKRYRPEVEEADSRHRGKISMSNLREYDVYQDGDKHYRRHQDRN